MTVAATEPRRLANSVRALRHRNFRLFTAGQSVSLLGTWMQQVAVGWLVYRMTQSPLLLGVVSFAALAPGFVIAPFAGVLADRYRKQRIIIATQIAMMCQALVLAGLVLTGHVTVGWILLLMTVMGVATGFDIPARQAFLVDMVGDRADLANAIALNSSIFNAARLVGPALAGFAIAAVGEGWVILLNGLSYMAVLFSLFAMRIDAPTTAPQTGPVFRRLAEGFRYAFGFAPIRALLGLVATVSLLGVPFSVLLPVVATEVLGGGPRTLGVLMAAVGFGALAGALHLASRSTVLGLGRVIAGAATLFGVSLILLAFANSIYVAVPLLACAGFGMMTQMASSNTVLQTVVDDDKRGRVMSFYTMAFMGTAPFGSLLLGAVADRFGAPAAMAGGGVACVLAAALFSRRLPVLRQLVRPIYVGRGILPEVALGLQAATHQATTDGGGATAGKGRT
jgi:MFS family permease